MVSIMSLSSCLSILWEFSISCFLPVELSLDDSDVPLKFLMESPQSGVLELNELVNVDQVVPEGHLVLFFGFVEVAIEHLEDSVLGVDFSVVVLLVNLNFLLELLGLGHPHDLPPVGQDLHPVEVGHLLLLVHLVFEDVPSHLHQLLLFVEVLHCLVLVSDLYHRPLLVSIRRLHSY